MAKVRHGLRHTFHKGGECLMDVELYPLCGLMPKWGKRGGVTQREMSR